MSYNRDKGNRDELGLTEYEKFRLGEPSYIQSKVSEEDKKKVKKKGHKEVIGWLVALTLIGGGIYGVTNHMFESREDVYQAENVARMTAEEAVENLYDSDGKYVRRDLTQEEYDQVVAMVAEVPESSNKVKINSRLEQAGEQIKEQLEAVELVSTLRLPNGEVNVDLDADVIKENLASFPSKFNPDYAKELKDKYEEASKVIKNAIKLEESIRALGTETGMSLDKAELDLLNKEVDGLPMSERKSRLTLDMKALYQEYTRQQDVIREEAEAESSRQAELAKLQSQEEARQRAESESLAREESILESQRLESEAEQSRILEEYQSQQDAYSYDNSDTTSDSIVEDDYTDVYVEPNDNESSVVEDNTPTDVTSGGTAGDGTNGTNGANRSSSSLVEE